MSSLRYRVGVTVSGTGKEESPFPTSAIGSRAACFAVTALSEREQRSAGSVVRRPMSGGECSRAVPLGAEAYFARGNPGSVSGWQTAAFALRITSACHRKSIQILAWRGRRVSVWCHKWPGGSELTCEAVDSLLLCTAPFSEGRQ